MVILGGVLLGGSRCVICMLCIVNWQHFLGTGTSWPMVQAAYQLQGV